MCAARTKAPHLKHPLELPQLRLRRLSAGRETVSFCYTPHSPFSRCLNRDGEVPVGVSSAMEEREGVSSKMAVLGRSGSCPPAGPPPAGSADGSVLRTARPSARGSRPRPPRRRRCAAAVRARPLLAAAAGCRWLSAANRYGVCRAEEK